MLDSGEIVMDTMKMGKLIAELRKQKGFTQQQLGETLNLSNKTISKWESGAGSPDISNLPILAETLGVSVDELLRGEVNPPKEQKPADSPTHETGKPPLTAEQKRERAILALGASVGAVLGILAYNFGWLG